MKRDVLPAWQRYQNSLEYMGQIGISTNAPKYVDLVEGRQWPPKTEISKNMPRPVINIIKMICRNKKAGILSSPVALRFRTADDKIDMDEFNRFGEYIAKEIDLEAVDSEVVEDAEVKGTGVWHFYWDSNAAGKRGNIDGGMVVEAIDPLNYHVANPNVKDEQKQAWLMISSREELQSLLERTETKYKQNVAANESDSPYQEVEQEHSKYVTVLTEYYRDNGAVYWQKHTKAGEITDPIPMTPKAEGGGDVFNKIFDVYPVVAFAWDRRDKSYLGISEVEGLEHNQKAINLGVALQLLKVQNETFGKWIVAEDALQDQEINNEIMQVLTDHSKLGNGIRKVAESPISGTPSQIIEGLLDMTRVVTGATEVMSGEVIGKGMSGAAIATLQAQAMKPLEEKQKAFWRAKQRQGMIMAEFFKFYYDGKKFSYNEKDENGTDTPKANTFNGKDYADTEIQVIVQAGAATAYSEGGDIAMLEALVAKGMISKTTFIEAYPDNALSNKQRIQEAFAREEQGQIAELTKTVQVLQAQIEKAADIIKAQSETVDKAALLVAENQRLKEQIITLGAEFTQKITSANQKIAETNTDAALFAQTIEQMLARADKGNTGQ